MSTDGGGKLPAAPTSIRTTPDRRSIALLGMFDYYPSDKKGLAWPRSLDKDMVGVEYLSLRGKTNSFLDCLSLLFVRAREGDVPGSEERPARGLVEKGEERERGVKKTKPASPALVRRVHVSKEDSSTSDTSSVAPLVMRTGEGSCSIDRDFGGAVSALGAVTVPNRGPSPPSSRSDVQSEAKMKRTLALGVPLSRSVAARTSESPFLGVREGEVSPEPSAPLVDSQAIIARDLVLEVPALDVVGATAPTPLPQDEKALMFKGMFRLGFQMKKGCPYSDLQRRVEASRVCVSGLWAVHTSEGIFDHLKRLLEDLVD
ncbi:hypothetical protein AMTR_s00031p00095250 [Amborella trichopoda]|uniref:Uncharacterized protein n=1 Tax=Amborella trichopoda TaxID=13333 RepID=U5CTE8_AMBTC|nr:hypothetical protein AMTR_s00031p00095250 [Amborella trichopoda]